MNDTRKIFHQVNTTTHSSNQPTPAFPPVETILWTPLDILAAIVVAIILTAIILATIVGNALVITAICTERNLRTVANYLIASLAVADLLVASLVMPILAINEVSHRWVLGAIMCEAWVSLDVLCCTASILHLLAIAVDRYWAVTRASYIHDRPVRPIVLMIVFSWVVSVLLCIPSSFVWRSDGEIDTFPSVGVNGTFPIKDTNIQNATLQIIYKIDNKTSLIGVSTTRIPRPSQRIPNDPDETGICKISQDWGYTVYSTMAAFYIPLIAIIIIYLKVYRVARRRIRKRQFAPNKGPNKGPDKEADKNCKNIELKNENTLDNLTCADLKTGDQGIANVEPIAAEPVRNRFRIFSCCAAGRRGGYCLMKKQPPTAADPVSERRLQKDATISCFSLTPTNQNVLPSNFVSSATATTSLAVTSGDFAAPSDQLSTSVSYYGQVQPANSATEHTQLAASLKSSEELNKPIAKEQNINCEVKDNVALTSKLEVKDSLRRGEPLNFPLREPPAPSTHQTTSSAVNVAINNPPRAKEEATNGSCKVEKSDDDIQFERRSAVQKLVHRELPLANDKLAGRDVDSTTADKQITSEHKQSMITFRTSASPTAERRFGLQSSTDDIADDYDNDNEDDAIKSMLHYEEDGEDGDDENNDVDPDESLLRSKVFRSSDHLQSHAEQPQLPSSSSSRRNSIQCTHGGNQAASRTEALDSNPVHCPLQRRVSSQKRQHGSRVPAQMRPKQFHQPFKQVRHAKERRAKEKREQAREKKAARTLAIITGSFVMCWLPFFITALVMPFCGDNCYMPPVLDSIIAWLGYLNSGLNPVIYTVFNMDFRNAFKKIVFGKHRKR